MKIVHIMISAFYREGFGYQENILPAKHMLLGHEVTIVTYDRYKVYGDLKADGRGTKSYVNKDGVRVVVLPESASLLKRFPLWEFRRFVKKTKYLFEVLSDEKPDVVFVHNLPAADHKEIVAYKKEHPQLKVYCDSHSDYYNSPVNTLRLKIGKKVFTRHIVKPLANIAERVWGVTPWRVKYLHDVFGISTSKLGLLVMGGDEEKIKWDNRNIIREKFRCEHNIPNDAFVVVTGGKIDKPKNIHLLIEAVKRSNNSGLYLLVFGNYSEDLKQYSEGTDPRIVNLGWVASDAVYDIFLASDFGAFPGTHSVLWEQACATGLPCLFKDWNGGFNHVDLGGNCIILKDVTVDSLMQTLNDVMNNQELFTRMKEVANTKCRKEFAYVEIAKRAIGLESNT